MTITPERLAELRVVAENFPRGQKVPGGVANYNYELFLDTFSPSTVIDLIESAESIQSTIRSEGSARLERENHALRDRLAEVEDVCDNPNYDWRWNDASLRPAIRAVLKKGTER